MMIFHCVARTLAGLPYDAWHVASCTVDFLWPLSPPVVGFTLEYLGYMWYTGTQVSPKWEAWYIMTVNMLKCCVLKGLKGPKFSHVFTHTCSCMSIRLEWGTVGSIMLNHLTIQNGRLRCSFLFKWIGWWCIEQVGWTWYLSCSGPPSLDS
jgi:hypothetical protein